MRHSLGFSPPTRGLFLANIDPKLNCSAKKMSEAVPAPEIKFQTGAEPPLRLEKPLPETPASEEPFSTIEERTSAKPYQEIQLLTKETSGAAILAANRPENGPKSLLEPERALPGTPALESLNSLASALTGWPPPTPKPATLSEPSRSIDDIQARKESDLQNSLPASPSKAEIRNFSRPLGTPRAPLGSWQPPPPNVSRLPRLAGPFRFSRGLICPTMGDVATASHQLASVNGGKLRGKHKNETMCQKGESCDSRQRGRSCSRCELM